MINYNINMIAEEIIKYCISNNKKFIFISGNGGSGKTEFSKILSKEVLKHGNVNTLDMDDFVVNTKLRNNAIAKWNDSQGKEHTGRFTTSFIESYFLQNVKAIMCNLEKGNNYYHWPKRAKRFKECRLLYGNAILTIIEGVGTVFLDKNKSNFLSVFLQCKNELAINRRIQRAEKSNEKTVEEVTKQFNERNSQYEFAVKPHISEYSIVLESNDDFSLNILRDDYNIIK